MFERFDTPVRCSAGHLFTTIWLPFASLKAVRLGGERYQHCPVGHHWAAVTPLDLDSASPDGARPGSAPPDAAPPGSAPPDGAPSDAAPSDAAPSDAAPPDAAELAQAAMVHDIRIP